MEVVVLLIVVSSNDDFNSSGSSDFNGSDTGGDKFGRITWLRVRGSHNGILYGLIGQCYSLG